MGLFWKEEYYPTTDRDYLEYKAISITYNSLGDTTRKGNQLGRTPVFGQILG